MIHEAPPKKTIEAKNLTVLRSCINQDLSPWVDLGQAHSTCLLPKSKSRKMPIRDTLHRSWQSILAQRIHNHSAVFRSFYSICWTQCLLWILQLLNHSGISHFTVIVTAPQNQWHRQWRWKSWNQLEMKLQVTGACLPAFMRRTGWWVVIFSGAENKKLEKQPPCSEGRKKMGKIWRYGW